MPSPTPEPMQPGCIGLVVSEDAEDTQADLSAQDIETRQVVAAAEAHGLRLDKALALWVPEFSRSYLQQLLEQGAVAVNGARKLKASTKVRAGDAVLVELVPTQQSQAFLPQAMALDIVYQDEHLLVVNKPAGLVVHPAPGNWSGTLLNGLLAHDPQAATLPRAGIVHRLDKDTSGLMVVARQRGTMDALVKLIAAREVHRNYLALAHGAWHGASPRTVELPIGRDPKNRLRMAAVDLNLNPGKPARTDIRLLVNGGQGDAKGCLVHCSLHTGRTHQIRVHMAALRHPLVADELYGGAPAAGMRRQALHATRLAFVHPVTGRDMEFHAPLPPDIAAALREWGISYNP
ncbi:RluA family pseudouridine synthase [Comamonas humi]